MNGVRKLLKTEVFRSSLNILKSFFAPAFILAAGAVMIIAGIKNGELAEIMQKAIFICLECIGIG